MKINPKKLILPVCAVLVVLLPGQTSFQALDVPVTAEILGFSGGHSSVSSNEVASNPAALAAKRPGVQLNYALYPASIRFHYLSAVVPFADGIAGVSLLNLDYGTLQDSETQNSFTAGDIVIRAAWKSTFLNSFSYGVSVKYFYSKLETATASGIALDAGLRTRLVNRRLGLGLSLENAGGVFSAYGSYREKLPLAFRVAVDYRPRHLPAILSIDAVNYRYDDLRYIGAVEFFTSENVTLRLSTSSYKQDLETGDYNEKFISGMAGGFGINFKRFKLDVGFQDLGSAGVVTAFSLKYGL
ncbi:MAG: hypothetical protein GXO91_06280 [FCB group bacterium]|nr:hypothetical protein [FCB group bacterium]